MKATYRAALMAAALVSLIPLSARAEVRAGTMELEPFAGYNFFEHRQNLKNNLLYGARFGFNFTQHLGLEASAAFINTSVYDRSVPGTKKGMYGSPTDGVNLNYLSIDAVYTFNPDDRFNRFVVAGMGIDHSNPPISNNDMTAFNVGVGAKYRVTDRAALRFDLRDFMITENFHDNFHNIAATVGISFTFGGKKAEPVAENKPEPVAENKPQPKIEETVVVILVSEPEAVKKVVAIVQEPRKVVILALEDLHFDFDESVLTPEAKVVLKRNFEILAKNPNVLVRIAGYTSARGTEEYNQKLSERRAHAVLEYLVAEKVASPERLSEIGYGKHYPAVIESAPKDMYSDAAKANMRVLFELTVNGEAETKSLD